MSPDDYTRRMHWYARYMLASRLGAQARLGGESLSALTRQAVEQWLQRQAQAAESEGAQR